MLKKQFLPFLFIVFSSGLVISQENHSKSEFRIGVGRSVLGTGDIYLNEIDGQINFDLSNHFSIGLGIAYGFKIRNDRIMSLALWRSNLHLLFSPFKIDRLYSFEIGGGISYHNANYIRRISSNLGYMNDQSNSFGYSIIMNNKIRLSSNNKIILSLFTNPYFNSNINSGLLVSWSFSIPTK